MTWFKEIPLPLNNDEHWNEAEFNYSIKRLEQAAPSESPDFINDIVLQWVIMPFIISKGDVYQISLNDSKLKEYTSTVLTHLFNSVQGVYVDGELVGIRLEELKQKIQSSFTELVIDTNKINPLVKDFYLKENVQLSK